MTNLPTPRSGGPARVSLNSFGYGGTNCHIILEAPDFPKTSNGKNGTNGHHSNGINGNDIATNGIDMNQPSSLKGTNSACPELFVLSASTEKALLSRAEDIRLWIKAHQPTPEGLHSLSYTLGVCRSALSFRRAIVASTTEELLEELKVPGPQKRVAALAPVSFVFSGQGAQWNAMGLELIQSSHIFKNSILAMEDVLRLKGCPWSLVEELSKSPENSRIGEAEIAQPATTAIQIALVDLLESFSIRPSRVVGHSSGEIAAAYAAGALSRDSAIQM